MWQIKQWTLRQKYPLVHPLSRETAVYVCLPVICAVLSRSNEFYKFTIWTYFGQLSRLWSEAKAQIDNSQNLRDRSISFKLWWKCVSNRKYEKYGSETVPKLTLTAVFFKSTSIKYDLRLGQAANLDFIKYVNIFLSIYIHFNIKKFMGNLYTIYHQK